VPGEVILASLGDSKFGFFATHNIPLSLIPSLSANLENVYVGGVEPGELEVGEGLSDSVRSSVAKITSVVESALRGGPDGFD
jgi:Ni,Fe-hydrogenase maturation factor